MTCILVFRHQEFRKRLIIHLKRRHQARRIRVRIWKNWITLCVSVCVYMCLCVYVCVYIVWVCVCVCMHLCLSALTEWPAWRDIDDGQWQRWTYIHSDCSWFRKWWRGGERAASGLPHMVLYSSTSKKRKKKMQNLCFTHLFKHLPL